MVIEMYSRKQARVKERDLPEERAISLRLASLGPRYHSRQ